MSIKAWSNQILAVVNIASDAPHSIYIWSLILYFEEFETVKTHKGLFIKYNRTFSYGEAQPESITFGGVFAHYDGVLYAKYRIISYWLCTLLRGGVYQSLTRVSISRNSRREITLGFPSRAGEVNCETQRFTDQKLSSTIFTCCPSRPVPHRWHQHLCQYI